MMVSLPSPNKVIERRIKIGLVVRTSNLPRNPYCPSARYPILDYPFTFTVKLYVIWT